MNRPRSKSSTADLLGCRLFLEKKHFRLVLLGSTGVGKTCIVSRLLYEKFIQHHLATVEELHSGVFEINGIDVTLELLDTSGSFEFPAMRRLSIMTGDGFILVFGMNDKSSFDKIDELRKEIMEIKHDPKIPIVIIANKSDLCPRFISSCSAVSRETSNAVSTSPKVCRRFSLLNDSDDDDNDCSNHDSGTSSASNNGNASDSDSSAEKRKVVHKVVNRCPLTNGQFAVAVTTERRGSVFTNGNSALEKCLQKKMMDEDKKLKTFYGERTRRNSAVKNQRNVNIGNATFSCRTRVFRKCSAGSCLSRDGDAEFSKMADLATQLGRQHMQQHSRRQRYNNQLQEQHRYTTGTGSEETYSKTIDRKVVESIVTLDWGHGFVEISAKNDDDVSMAIFKSLLLQVDVRLQEIQCLPPPKNNGLERLLMFRNKRRVSEDTKVKYRRNSCKVS